MERPPSRVILSRCEMVVLGTRRARKESMMIGVGGVVEGYVASQLDNFHSVFFVDDPGCEIPVLRFREKDCVCVGDVGVRAEWLRRSLPQTRTPSQERSVTAMELLQLHLPLRPFGSPRTRI